MAVGCSLRCLSITDVASTAANVLDIKLSAESFAQPLSNEPREDVRRAANSERDDYAHRPRRIGLRPRHARDGRQRDSASGQMQKSSARKFHRSPLNAAFVSA